MDKSSSKTINKLAVWYTPSRHDGKWAYHDSNSYEKVKTLKYLGSLLTNQNSIHDEMKCRLKAGNSCLLFGPNAFVFSTWL